MENNKLKQVELNLTDMLVTRIPDYFKIKAKGQFDTQMAENDGFSVGIIEAVGDGLMDNRIGKIIYYHKDVSQLINVKGIGEYELVHDASKILIRMDQSSAYY